MQRHLRNLFYMLLVIIGGGWAGASCTNDDNDTANEYENWQARNDAYFATLEDSLLRQPTQWRKFKNFSYNESTVGANTDYIYVKVISEGEAGNDCPLYTDTVRVSYQGRLINGTTFDKTIYGSAYDPATSATVKLAVGGTNGVVDGFATALQHMTRSAYWRIYIPYNLGYGSKENNAIPAYSTLIFDLALLDFYKPGKKTPTWSARQLR